MRLLIILFFISINCFAGYMPGSKIDGKLHTVTIFRDKSKCESVYSETCYKMPKKYYHEYHVLKDEMINDLSKPNWATRSMVETCVNEDDCKSKAEAKECADERWPLYNAEFTEVWCNKILSYDKKKSGRKIIAEDEAKKATHQAQEAAKKADQAAMAIVSKALDCGKKVISRMLLQNKPKNLSKAQVRNLVKTYKDIKNLLETGSLESAREDILAVTINEPIVTQSDKDALIVELDNCKP